MKRLSTAVSPKQPVVKKVLEKPLDLPEVALAAIVSFKKQKEVGDFINFILSALERNSDWLNSVVGKQNHFRCALMVGAGPNRFQIQEVIYPSANNDVKLEVEMRDSEDHDKIAITALLKLTNFELDNLAKYIKTRMMDNFLLRDDLLKGKSLGVTYAVLKPISEKQYRVMERIVIGSSTKCVAPPPKKRRREDDLMSSPVAKVIKK